MKMSNSVKLAVCLIIVAVIIASVHIVMAELTELVLPYLVPYTHNQIAFVAIILSIPRLAVLPKGLKLSSGRFITATIVATVLFMFISTYATVYITILSTIAVTAVCLWSVLFPMSFLRFTMKKELRRRNRKNRR